MNKLPEVTEETFLAFKREIELNQKSNQYTLVQTTFERMHRENRTLARYLWLTAMGFEYGEPIPPAMSHEEMDERTKVLAIGIGVYLLLERSL